MATTTVRAATSAGVVEGVDRDGILQYRDIPYAASTAGANRFRPPQPVEPWAGVRDVTHRGPIAPQNPSPLETMLGSSDRPQSEDCLSLTVTTPGLDGSRPVMVWIHGGGFTAGTGSIPWYDGTNLARRGDVVVVCINYRLGALGFGHVEALLGDEYAGAGNLGLLDQMAALRWVRDEIDRFGGDPGRVTVFGESAGAMSVATLLGLPAARGLFHRAVAQSGACRNIATADQAAEVAEILLRNLDASDPGILLDADVPTLLAAQQSTHNEVLTAGTRDLRLPFQPVLDGTVIERHPLDAVRDGVAGGIPLLAGTTAEEWAMFHLPTRAQGPLGAEQLVRWTDRLLDALGAAGDPVEVVDVYRRSRPGATPDDLWIAIGTDIAFRLPKVQLLEAQGAHAPTWAYHFAHRSPAFGGLLGACHAIEIPFVFDVLDKPGIPALLGDPDTALRDLAAATSQSWLAFAHAGDPRHEALPDWEQYSVGRRAVMELATERRLLEDPGAAERRLWSGLIA
jgi:para-nitrobenzyl esterase